jgi:hypothetical protein
MKTIIALFLLIPALVLADQSGMEFLKIGVGARAMAMAGAYVGFASGAEAGYWNPAGLTQIERIEFSATHLQWSTDVMYEFLTYGQKLPGIGSVGASLFYLDVGEIDARDEFGQVLPEISVYDACGMVSFARTITPVISGGLSLKGFQEKIGDDATSGFAVDVGGLIHVAKVNIGFNIQNLGMKLKFVDEEFSLPMTARLGVAFHPLPALVLALDGDYQVVNKRGAVHFGGEYWVKEMVAVRAGYQYKSEDDQLDLLNGLGAGLGVKYMKFGIDYGYEPSPELGDIHRISLKVSL